MKTKLKYYNIIIFSIIYALSSAIDIFRYAEHRRSVRIGIVSNSCS